MKKSSSLFISGLCAAGLLCGFATRRLSAGRFASAPVLGISPREPAPREKSATPASAPGRPAPTEIPHRRSTDTLETLSALGDGELYTRLAVWLTDASEGDIAAFWKIYGPRKGRSQDITNLVFLNWTRLDPQAAIAGSSNDLRAWWAWTCHDPKAALAAATGAPKLVVLSVAWGIGEFRPEWLREHFNELPESARIYALEGIAMWDDLQDPLAAMKFGEKNGGIISKGTFQAFIRQDPWAALDWAQEKSRLSELGFDTPFADSMQIFIETLASERPEDLERIAAQTPSGAAKLKMESALFDNLLKTDPEAALASAKETAAPRIAAERFAAIGLGVVKTDPEQAFGLAKELLTKFPDALGMVSKEEYPGGFRMSSVDIPGVQDFLRGLMEKDPARTLEMMKPPSYGGEGFKNVASGWAERDFVAYTDWVNRQTDPSTRDQCAYVIIDNLQAQGNYDEAADWVLTRKEGAHDGPIIKMLSGWKQADAQAAAAWLETANLPEDRKAKIRSVMDQVR